MAEHKIFAGPRIRRIRNRLGHSQTAMATALGISPSYLNLIERNQRPLTVQLLLKLSSVYDIDIAELQGEAGGETMDRLREVFSDPLLSGELPSPAELIDVAEAAPNAARALVRLYEAYRETTGRLSDLSGAMARGAAAQDVPRAATAFAEVTTYFEAANPWVPELEAAATRIAAELSPRDDMFGAIKARLRSLLSIEVRVLPAHALPADRARFDRHSHRVFLSESLTHDEKTYLAAMELAFLGERGLLKALAKEAGFESGEAERLARLMFARKLASAILMPAERLLRVANDLRYDISRLARRFGVAPGRVMERLAVARDPDADWIEFAFLSADPSGGLDVKIPGAGYPTPRFGALCPRLPVFDALPAGKVSTASVEFPGGERFQVLAAADETFAPPDGAPPPRRLATLAATPDAMANTVYASHKDADVRPVGSTCRLCERRACPARAMPAATRPAALNEYALGMSDYDPA